MTQTEAQLAAARENGTPEQVAALEQTLSQLKAAHAQQSAAWQENADELNAAFAALDAARAALDAEKENAEKEFDAAEQELSKTEETLTSGEAALAAGEKAQKEGAAKLKTAKADYAAAKKDADKALADAEKKLADAKKQISEIADGVWYVLDRNTNVGYVSFHSNTEKVEAIARVFPVFFFLVAALVATTTMTRMVDENRLQMGTLKALGYSNASIAGKYLFYALTASVLGSMAGMVVGFLVFPSIIWYAYQLIFSLPTFTLRFYPGMAAASVAISAAVIGLATWSACRSSLKEKSAALLRKIFSCQRNDLTDVV